MTSRAPGGSPRPKPSPGHNGAAIVAEARSWCGTPIVEHQAVKGVGCDCKGLAVGVARELGLPEAGSLHARMSDYRLSSLAYAPRLREGVAATLTPVAPARARPGDLLLCRFRGVPAHLAILTELPSGGLQAGAAPAAVEGGKAVHAQYSSTAHVKETALRVLFHFFPLDSVWRFGGRRCARELMTCR